MVEYSVTYKRVQPPVDIIIPFHGDYHLVSECVESILSRTASQVFTLTLVDDGSPNKEFVRDFCNEKLKNVPIQYFQHETHQGFGAALQTGFKETQNSWVCFFHADCKAVRPDWLSEMMICMQNMKKQGVKLISAKLSDGGTGSFDPIVIGSQATTEDRIAEQSLPLACVLVNRGLFDKVGGFVKPYPFGGYEDEDLFWRMKIKGFSQGVCGRAYVEHKGGITIKSLMQNPKYQAEMLKNEERCIQDVRAFAKVNK